MKWRGRTASSNVEDRRGMGGKGIGIAGGGFGLVIALIYMFLGGGNPGDILNGAVDNGSQGEYVETDQEKELANFASVVLADTEAVWSDIFADQGKEYVEPTMVLFSGSVNSGCGSASAAMGPFYCPADQKLYIDLSFYEELKNRFDAPGDFAMAYVIAHEVGHHVQSLLGTSQQVSDLRGKVSKAEYNEASVRLELQADYYAGVFAKYAQGEGYLEAGDIEEAMNAASGVGDDAIMEDAGMEVNPESFTHGTSEQRMRWFEKGYENGTIKGGDTFSAKEL
ncbi:neutral zinc metallopeptidase [Paenisporosarcina cavernae]|uniref:Metalloprotease n=1 Tax=Paenisporosarcina cavernae TaxID=2320858 RepID=A0A385YX24_9BACL|nr:neutral zinc metallopeptidase [Paenisporosarcina cavernae]AYC30238.1 metalloprotease [Paenisporosarcina cavernae]